MQTNVCGKAKGVQSVDIAAQPGQGIGRDIATGEKVEAEIDAFASRRHEQRVKNEGERLAEEVWMESERAYFARRDEDRRLERLAYHEGQAQRLSGVLGSLVAHHQAEAEKYRQLTKLTKGLA
jgi:hypothetical protein